MLLYPFKTSSKNENTKVIFLELFDDFTLSEKNIKNKFIFLPKGDIKKFIFCCPRLDNLYSRLTFKKKVVILEQFFDCFLTPPRKGLNLAYKQKIINFKNFY